ncbi:hypothetical protein Ahy_B06g083130 [Arachis hypogaea]|uniref:Pyruvate phosphate dikinase AMP/ATP-binding domain-containing protein n=1 Tax=Arachis hypogaea TaxID=3818 RepID=A0A444YPG0_ARAHY|nr:hypothetical protein Ahy_B06g083130 [Arachis hypogaea]
MGTALGASMESYKKGEAYVWGSKWNERAYFSTRKVKLDHECLSMAVLVQEVINADYAFVIHTTNPSSGDTSEIYTEKIRVNMGNYPYQYYICCMNFLLFCMNVILGYPSKPVGLFIRRSIIFRYDSNGEDLEGYAGAGLYDRCSALVMQRGKAFYDFQFNNTIPKPYVRSKRRKFDTARERRNNKGLGV